MIRPITWICLCALAALLGGCQAGTLSESAAIEHTQSARALTAADDGTTVNLRVGEVLSVALSGNASTGYSWTLSDGGAPVLVQSGSPVSASEASAAGLVGAPEIFTWNFVAQQSGEGVLKLEYRRSWEEGVAPARTFTVKIKVTE